MRGLIACFNILTTRSNPFIGKASGIMSDPVNWIKNALKWLLRSPTISQCAAGPLA